MAILTFKIPENEKKFLDWWSQKSGEASSSIYRNVTIEIFKKWKIDMLIIEYSKGSIGFKKFSNLAGMSFNETSLLLQKENIEAPISDLIDEYTSHVRDKFMSSDIFKIGNNYK